jgi:uncharacterized membrane protein YhhN
MIQGDFLPMIRRLNKLFVMGLWFFLAANLWHFAMRASTSLSENWVDGIHGLLLGVSIGCMLIGIVRNSRSNCAQTKS